MPQLTGYAKWEETGKWLHHQADKPNRDYESMSEDELKKLKTTAEIWLNMNQGHKNYAKALANFEKIENQLDLLAGKGII